MPKFTIYELAGKGDFEEIKLRVEQNHQIIYEKDETKKLLIHWAALSGNIELVQFLIDNGSPINPEDENKTTPLIVASSAGEKDTVSVLLYHGAGINHQDKDGHSSLQYACFKEWKKVVKCLLLAGADVNLADIRGYTPLHRSASKGLTSIVKILLKTRNINVNAVDCQGNTAFHLACLNNQMDEVELIFEAGGNINLLNKNQKRAWDLGKVTVHSLISKLLSKTKAGRLPLPGHRGWKKSLFLIKQKGAK